MKKIRTIAFLSLIVMSFHSNASTGFTLAHCEGAKLPNGIALSFDLVKSTNDSGSDVVQVNLFMQTPGKPIGLPSIERCESFTHVDSKLTCNTVFGETYTVDTKTKKATESSDDSIVKYRCK